MATETPVEEFPADLLRDAPGELADLYRKDSTIAVQVIFLPDIDKPEGAHVTFYDPNDDIIDQIDYKVDPKIEDRMKVFCDQVMEAFHHPAVASRKVADKIAGRTS